MVQLPTLPVLQQLNSSNLLAATPPLASLPSLTSLDLSSNKISEVSTLGQAAKLTKLVLRGNALTSTKASARARRCARSTSAPTS